nr:MAG TPA: hypothetical protein [Caudoviricetes sp.]
MLLSCPKYGVKLFKSNARKGVKIVGGYYEEKVFRRFRA